MTRASAGPAFPGVGPTNDQMAGSHMEKRRSTFRIDKMSSRPERALGKE
jgi:hypothetical protein